MNRVSSLPASLALLVAAAAPAGAATLAGDPVVELRLGLGGSLTVGGVTTETPLVFAPPFSFAPRPGPDVSFPPPFGVVVDLDAGPAQDRANIDIDFRSPFTAPPGATGSFELRLEFSDFDFAGETPGFFGFGPDLVLAPEARFVREGLDGFALAVALPLSGFSGRVLSGAFLDPQPDRDGAAHLAATFLGSDFGAALLPLRDGPEDLSLLGFELPLLVSIDLDGADGLTLDIASLVVLPAGLPDLPGALRLVIDGLDLPAPLVGLETLLSAPGVVVSDLTALGFTLEIPAATFAAPVGQVFRARYLTEPETAVVPIPAGLPLLAGGLAVLGALRRRRR